MMFPSREIVEIVKSQYPKGTKVRLISMNDPYHRLKAGDEGIVSGVDDMATIHVHWDSGLCLGVIYGEDYVEAI